MFLLIAHETQLQPLLPLVMRLPGFKNTAKIVYVGNTQPPQRREFYIGYLNCCRAFTLRAAPGVYYEPLRPFALKFPQGRF